MVFSECVIPENEVLEYLVLLVWLDL